MINDTRVKVAMGLLTLVLSLLGGAQAHAASGPVRYQCEARQNLVIERSARTAHVRFIDREYSLGRKASSMGEKYASSTAALIIDGRSAVFVAEDRLQLGACVEAGAIAAIQ